MKYLKEYKDNSNVHDIITDILSDHDLEFEINYNKSLEVYEIILNSVSNENIEFINPFNDVYTSCPVPILSSMSQKYRVRKHQAFAKTVPAISRICKLTGLNFLFFHCHQISKEVSDPLGDYIRYVTSTRLLRLYFASASNFLIDTWQSTKIRENLYSHPDDISTTISDVFDNDDINFEVIKDKYSRFMIWIDKSSKENKDFIEDVSTRLSGYQSASQQHRDNELKEVNKNPIMIRIHQLTGLSLRTIYTSRSGIVLGW